MSPIWHDLMTQSFQSSRSWISNGRSYSMPREDAGDPLCWLTRRGSKDGCESAQPAGRWTSNRLALPRKPENRYCPAHVRSACISTPGNRHIPLIDCDSTIVLAQGVHHRSCRTWWRRPVNSGLEEVSYVCPSQVCFGVIDPFFDCPFDSSAAGPESSCSGNATDPEAIRLSKINPAPDGLCASAVGLPVCVAWGRMLHSCW